MLLSEFSELLNVSFSGEEGQSPIKSTVIDYEMLRIDDYIKQIYIHKKDLLEEGRVVPIYATSSKDLSWYVSNKNLLVTIPAHHQQLRERVVTGLVIYNIWHKTLSAKHKNTTHILFALPIMSNVLRTITKRPVSGNQFRQQSLIWCTLHYLSLLKGSLEKVSDDDIHNMLYRFVKPSLRVERDLNEVRDKMLSEIGSAYSTRKWFALVADNLIVDTFDSALKALISKYGNNVTVSFEEPLYVLSEIVGGKLFGISSIYRHIESAQLKRLISYFIYG